MGTPPKQSAPFSLALVGGVVHTVSGREPVTGGVGIVGETIEAVGSDAEIRARCRQATTVVEVGGGEIVPGFCDSHTHPFWQGLQLGSLDLSGATSLGALLEEVAEASRKTRPGAWILGFGWDEGGWPERGLPDRQALDEAAPGRCVYLGRVCGHLAAVSSAALEAVPLKELSGLQMEGRRPTGLISGPALAEFFANVPHSAEERREALEAFFRACDGSGVTSVHAFVETLEELESLAALPEGPSLWAYGVHRPERPFPLNEARERLAGGAGSVRLVGVKLYCDGSIGSHTACLKRPYEDKPETSGKLALTKREMKELMVRFHAAGAQTALHAIGDYAIEQAVEAAARALAEGPAPALAPRIEHLEVVRPADLHRVARLGLVASLQPNFIGRWGQPSGLYEKRLGPRFAKMNPLRAFVRQGARVCFGSDGMPFGPLYGLASAGLHPDEEQRLSPSEALRAYTLGGAEALGLSDRGTIEPGKRADLAVLSAGTLEKPLQGRVVTTVRAGHVVWRA